MRITKGQGTILLVDDETIVREVNEEIIAALGYEVVAANNGCQALEIYKDKENVIDLVILDMIMPETKERRKENKTDSVSIISEFVGKSYCFL